MTESAFTSDALLIACYKRACYVDPYAWLGFRSIDMDGIVFVSFTRMGPKLVAHRVGCDE